jgi:hypothetical protein
MKQNTFVFLVCFCLAFLTHAFAGGMFLKLWQSVVGFLICLAFWLCMFAPAFKIEDNKL